MARSLNRVQLIGNLTRDPELRYTPTGTAVCSFGLATNRSWTTDTGERKEETEFHRIVAWNKLAELCSQFLIKGRKVYLEGRLSTRSWTTQDGQQRSATEVVIDDMILLDQKRPEDHGSEEAPAEESKEEKKSTAKAASAKSKKQETQEEDSAEQNTQASAPADSEEVSPDDIPF
jgi:single-strand DNA-binding protein